MNVDWNAALECTIDLDAISGEGEWEEMYTNIVNKSGIYRIISEVPLIANGIKHDVLYIGESIELGRRICCHIEHKSGPEKDWFRQILISHFVNSHCLGKIMLQVIEISGVTKQQLQQFESTEIKSYSDSHDGFLPPLNRKR